MPLNVMVELSALHSKEAKLVLIPTPLNELGRLTPEAMDWLKLAEAYPEQYMVIGEEHKELRRRWLHWGLDRKIIDNFRLLNEQTPAEEVAELISLLKSGKSLLLLSDGGLPCFADPGRPLVNACHENSIRVTSAPFFNSALLALILSGFSAQNFFYRGFPPREKNKRKVFFKNLNKIEESTIIMDAPYRLHRVLGELSEASFNGECFIALNLSHPSELLVKGSLKKLKKALKGIKKAEFVLVLARAK